MNVALAVAMFAFFLQSTSPSDLLHLERPLTANELEAVVSGIRRALAGSTARLVQPGLADREILFGPGGTPRFVRYSYTGERVASLAGENAGSRGLNFGAPERFVRLVEYSGLAARYCDGARASGQMVVEYTQNVKTQRWDARVAEQDFRDAWALPQLQMLATPTSLMSIGTKGIGGSMARGIVAPSAARSADDFLITGDPAPNPAEFRPVETLWIDASSMLPVRWEISQREAIVSAVDFVYAPLAIARPAGVAVPKCIP